MPAKDQLIFTNMSHGGLDLSRYSASAVLLAAMALGIFFYSKQAAKTQPLFTKPLN